MRWFRPHGSDATTRQTDAMADAGGGPLVQSCRSTRVVRGATSGACPLAAGSARAPTPSGARMVATVAHGSNESSISPARSHSPKYCMFDSSTVPEPQHGSSSAPPRRHLPLRTWWAQAKETAWRASCGSVAALKEYGRRRQTSVAAERLATAALTRSSATPRYHNRGVRRRSRRSAASKEGAPGRAAATTHRMSELPGPASRVGRPHARNGAARRPSRAWEV
eukprot:scaffold7308_cov114-Isochrysis_galbana.AAC.2